MSNNIADDPSQWMNTKPDAQAQDSARHIGVDRDYDSDDYDTLRYELEAIVDGDYDDLIKQGEHGIGRLKRAIRGTLRASPKRSTYRRDE